MSMLLWLATNRGLRLTEADLSESYSALLDESWDLMAAQTQSHQSEWRLGQSETWDLDQTTGCLRFTYSDGVVVKCAAQIIGSWSEDNSWLWAWANSHVDPMMVRDAEQVHQYGIAHQLTQLLTPKWNGEIDWAWSMTALAAQLTNADGCYSGPDGNVRVFMIFRNATIIQP